MRGIIKKILLEEFDPEDLSWVDTDLEPIRDRQHRIDIIQKTIAKVKEYKGWRIHQDSFDGVVYWTGVDGYTGMATPEWDTDFRIPVDVTWGPGLEEYDTLGTIGTPKFEYVVEVEDWYRNNYFEKVYNMLTDFITPI